MGFNEIIALLVCCILLMSVPFYSAYGIHNTFQEEGSSIVESDKIIITEKLFHHTIVLGDYHAFAFEQSGVRWVIVVSEYDYNKYSIGDEFEFTDKRIRKGK